MHIQLTSYLLQFKYSDFAYEDPLLLSREIIKKAYNEGLYYIASSKEIDKIIKNKKISQNDISLYAGIPTLQDLSFGNEICSSFYALRICFPYEILASFNYANGGLFSNHVSLMNIPLKKECLKLEIVDDTPMYVEDKSKYVLTRERQDMIKNYFIHDLKNDYYLIQSNINYLGEQLTNFLSSSECLNQLDNLDYLNYIKETYEEIIPLMNHMI